MTTDHAVCPSCGHPIGDVVAAELDQVVNDPGTNGGGPTLQEIVERVARKCLGDPGLDQWQARRDLA